MKTQNPIQDKSYDFSLRIVRLCKFLCEEKQELNLSRQLVRSGTSIGANVEEGIGAFSKKDFRYKLSIAYKEDRETKFWIKLLRDSGFIEKKLSKSLLDDCEELFKNTRSYSSNHIKVILKTFLIEAFLIFNSFILY